MTQAYVPARILDTWDIVLPEYRRNFWAERKDWERGRLEHCAEHMKPGMTVLECGSECGDMTSLYRQFVEPYGTVIPMEPSHFYWDFIRGTWLANGFAAPPPVCYPGFAGNVTSGKSAICRNSWPADADLEGVPDGGFRHLAQDEHTPRITIDDLCSITSLHPDAITIDCEGAEWHILDGCSRVLHNDRPNVWVSVHDIGEEDGTWPGALKGWYDKTVEDIHTLMAGYGYESQELPWMGEGEHFWVYMA